MKTTAKLLSAMLLSVGVAGSANATLMRPILTTGCSNCMHSTDLEGRQVIGMNGHSLGYILALDQRAGLVELQTDGGIALALPEANLRQFGGMVYAPTLSQRQIVAMEINQTGRTVAWNAGVGIGNFRG